MQGPFYNRYNSALSPEERQGLYERLMDMSMSEGSSILSEWTAEWPITQE